MSLSKMIYRAGILVRNNKINSCYRFLKESETWSRNRLEEYQLQKLQSLLKYASTHSSHYRNKFREHGFAPGRVCALDDLRLVPLTTKEEVLSHVPSIQVTDSTEKLVFSETSGSTGRPLVFFRNQEWDAWHNAAMFRGFSWHGVNPWERNGYMWGYNIDPRKRMKVKVLDMLQNRFRLFSYKDQEIEEFIRKLENAAYLGGYSSMIYEVARRVNAGNSSAGFNLKMIKGTSEKIHEAYQGEVQKAFGRRIISEYGSAEGGIIAFECPHGRMHITMETALVEVIDGEIVVTNLVSNSFPIIRYKLGDYVTLDETGSCRCGMAHPVIKEVTGRVGSVIYGKEHTYPSLTLYYVFKNLALEKNMIINYQVIQEQKGTVNLHMETELPGRQHTTLMAEFRKYFSDDLDVVVKQGIYRDMTKGKRRDFISHLAEGR